MRARLMACLLGMIACGNVLAQEASYPERPIHLIVGFPPGGPNDLIARILQPRLGELLKQPVNIENRNGSNGEIATGYVAKAAPDGYTMLVASNGSITISPGLGKKLPYDSRRDLTPLTIVAASPMLLVVPLRSEAKSVADVIAMAKANPGKLSSASAGAAGPTHLALELFKSLAHVEIAHIPYKGGGPALTDAMGGQVDMYFGGLSTALPHVRAGKLRGLGVTTLARSTIAPEIPTIAETVPGYDASIWYGTFAPPGVPGPIAAKLHDAIVAAVRSPEVLAKLKQEGVDPMDNSSAQLVAFIREDIEKWARLAKSANIKPE